MASKATAYIISRKPSVLEIRRFMQKCKKKLKRNFYDVLFKSPGGGQSILFIELDF